MNIQSDITQFILEEVLTGSREQLGLSEPLVTSGILDSLAILRLITFLEDRYEIKVGDGEVGEENFETVERLGAFVESKLPKSGG